MSKPPGATPGPQTTFFVTSPRGVEDLLRRELEGLGLTEVTEDRAGVAFTGTLRDAYRVCLWSRLASRVLLPLARVDARSSEAFYHGVARIEWERHLPRGGTLWVDARIRQGPVENRHYVELKTKDAVVDRLRERWGQRPDVDRENPSLRLFVFIAENEATVSLDLAGQSLHRRGYRDESVEAPLKENLAAAILMRAGWPRIAAAGGGFVDPMCGSGTLPIEAASMAADVAPGLLRASWGFDRWLGHRAGIWAELMAEAEARAAAGRSSVPRILGTDLDPAAIRIARRHAEAATLADLIELRTARVESVAPPPGPAGLVAVNPPYGERLGDRDEVILLYQALGRRLREAFDGWVAAVLGPDEELLRDVGLRWFKTNRLFNGALECRLAHYRLGRGR